MKEEAIVFAGGGSGGHLFPGIAVAEEIARRCDSLDIVFVGSRKPIEQTILGDRNVTYRSINAAPSTLLKRNPVKFVWRYRRARRQARTMLKEIHAKAVVGLGGYASVPVVLAAHSLRIPTVLLEQNIVAGRANRWLSRRADLICHAFEAAVNSTPRAKASSVRVTGNPVRDEIVTAAAAFQSASKHRPRGSNASKPTLLILGGSQGATAVNEAVCAAIPQLAGLLRDWRVIHQTGPRDIDAVKTAYSNYGIEHTIAPFFADMVPHYAAAELAISRAGATSLAELSCCGIPTILIPIPNSLRNHQARNADHYAAADASVIVEQDADSQQTANALSSQLGCLLADEPARLRMSDAMSRLSKPSAAHDVAGLILDLIGATRIAARASEPVEVQTL